VSERVWVRRVLADFNKNCSMCVQCQPTVAYQLLLLLLTVDRYCSVKLRERASSKLRKSYYKNFEDRLRVIMMTIMMKMNVGPEKIVVMPKNTSLRTLNLLLCSYRI